MCNCVAEKKAIQSIAWFSADVRGKAKVYVTFTQLCLMCITQMSCGSGSGSYIVFIDRKTTVYRPQTCEIAFF